MKKNEIIAIRLLSLLLALLCLAPLQALAAETDPATPPAAGETGSETDPTDPADPVDPDVPAEPPVEEVKPLTAPAVSAGNKVGGIQVTWGAVEGAESYRIYRKNGSSWKQIGTSSGTSYTDKDVSSGKSYTYTVRAVREGELSPYNTKGVSCTYLAAPKLKSAQAVSNGIQVKWEKVSAGKGYTLYRKSGSSGWQKIATIKSKNTTSYTDKNAAAGVKYTYTVRATKDSIQSGYDTKGISQLWLTAPKLKSAANAAGGIQVKWDAVKGAEKYKVYRKNGSSWKCIATVTGTSATDKSVSSGKKYTYTVQAICGSTSSSYKTKTVSCTYLAAPKLKSAKSVDGGIQVTWEKISAGKGYTLYRKTEGTGWQKIATISSNNTTSYKDTKAPSGGTYIYTVRATKGSLQSGYDTKGISCAYLAAPKLKSAAIQQKGLLVSWNAVDQAERYQVYRKSGSSGWQLLETVEDGTSFLDETVSSGTKYTYTVRARKGSLLSAYNTQGVSNTWLTTPVLKNVTISGDALKVSWEKVSGSDGYTVWRKIGGTGWKKIGTIKSGNTTSYTDKNVSYGSDYIYTVRATKGSVQSMYSYAGVSGSLLKTPVLDFAYGHELEGIHVVWDEVPGAEGYTVWRKINDGGWQKIATLSDLNANYQDPAAGLTVGTKYTYTVRAISGSCQSGYDKTGLSVTFVKNPVLVSAEAGMEGIRVTWEPVPGAERYEILRADGDCETSPKDWTNVVATLQGPEVSSWLDTDVEDGCEYRYAVRICCGNTRSKPGKSLSATYRAISLNHKTLTLQPGEHETLTIQGSGDTALWTSSDPAIVTVENGAVTAQGIGTAVISVQLGEYTLTCNVLVTNAHLSEAVLFLRPDQTASLSVLEAVGAPTWTSSDPAVVTVENGAVAARSLGEATIAAVADGITMECHVTVATIHLSQTSLELLAGETASLTVQNAQGALEWTSSDPAVVKVENGAVAAVDSGEAVITVRDEEGEEAACTVRVRADMTALGEKLTDVYDNYLCNNFLKQYRTKESWADLTGAYDTAKALYDAGTAKVQEVADAETSLQTAIDALQPYTFSDGELVWYPEYSKAILEEINEYRVENGLNAYEWNDKYAKACLEQAAYNAITYELNYEAAYESDWWDAARHASCYIGCALCNANPSKSAKDVADDVVPRFKASNTHNKNLLNSLGAKYGGVAFCSYTINNKTTYVCIVLWGMEDTFVSKYNKFSGLDFDFYSCTMEDIHNCKTR